MTPSGWSVFSSCFFFVMLLHSVISHRWAPQSLASFLQVESRFSLVIAFCLVFSHILHSPVFLLFSCFFCATMPPALPLPASRCNCPYGGLAWGVDAPPSMVVPQLLHRLEARSLGFFSTLVLKCGLGRVSLTRLQPNQKKNRNNN